MSENENIDRILEDWIFDPNSLMVRKAYGDDGRGVLQMRIDLGVMQLETSGRPDGSKPNGFESVYENLFHESLERGEDFEMDDTRCFDVDREFVQFYHRRICWLQLKEYENAVRDADHTLKLMDFCRLHSPDEEWTLSHEQYRPFVMFHRIQAAAFAAIERDEGAESAIEEINTGLEKLRILFEEFSSEENFEDEELAQRLIELREELRKKYQVGQTLTEKLSDAVAQEQYELAAQLRDELDRKGRK
ncbi:MAG: UvrB/UvrC motif-containing protein [Planctomycetota bacterium]|nr:UvrB/UvrC motif-containing protein [Planctomycetota bacterium]